MDSVGQLGWCRGAILASLGLGAIGGCSGEVTDGRANGSTQGGSDSAAPFKAPDASSGGGSSREAAVEAGGGHQADEGGHEAGEFACPVTQDASNRDLGGGFVSTAEGWIHRPEPAACPDLLPPVSSVPVVVDGGVVVMGSDAGLGANCLSDIDCTEGPHGRCRVTSVQTSPYPWASFQAVLSCQYGCVTDGDCLAGQLCECGAEIGRCVSASCQSDADCDSGSLCAPRWYASDCPTPWSVIGYECKPVGFQCCTDADCGGAPYYKCANGTCERMFVGCGRPFLVKEEARVARAITREDVAYSLAPAVAGLTPAVRTVLARHWTEVALLEHASVAAFARFVLDLLALGAPADLVVEAQRAGADELEHTRLAFGMAAAFLGAAIGPGPLPVAGALDDRDRTAIVVCAFREGCVGETLAAVEAAAARDASRDPVVRGVLARIAEDELRHATLAYRFVAWALRNAAPDERARLVAILRAEHRKLVGGNPSRAAGVEDQMLIDGGLLPDHARRDLAVRATREVVTPCFEALLRSVSEAPLAHAAA